MPSISRTLMPGVLIAFAALACNKDQGAKPLAQDSTLSRDLQLANSDSGVQPQFKDTAITPAAQPESTPAAQPAPAPTPAPARTTPPRHSQPRPRPARPSAPSQSASEPAPQPAAPAGPVTTASGNTMSESAAGSEGVVGTIPAGTVINLTSNDKVCTNTNKVGDQFTATVNNAVVGTNGAIIPAGAKALIQVTDLQRSGNASQPIKMSFNVLNVSFNGKAYPVNADIEHVDIDKVRNASTGSDAAKVAGGAVVGAIIGQIIGHNTKGTVIGAATGAAAGTGVAMGTAAYEGCIPSGGNIRVHLVDPATVTTR